MAKLLYSFLLLALAAMVHGDIMELEGMDPNMIMDMDMYDMVDERIVGGYEAPEGAFPYQISLRQNNRHFCGGSILNSRWIITAAHCVQGQGPYGMTVVVGTNSLTRGGTGYHVEQLIPHTGYSGFAGIVNDIALVRVTRDITFNNRVQPIGLPDQDFPVGTPLTLSGWGKISHPGNSLPNQLQTIQLTSISNEECLEQHDGKTIYETNVCTMSPYGQGACHGDSGGPLAHGNHLVGVVSWGIPCAKGKPDVFTRVYSYLDWIENNAY